MLHVVVYNILIIHSFGFKNNPFKLHRYSMKFAIRYKYVAETITIIINTAKFIDLLNLSLMSRIPSFV